MHIAAQRLKDIGSYLESVAIAIEQGHVECVPEALSQAHRLLCNEIICWNKEMDPILDKLKKLKKGD
jgi:mevalonate kinase